MNDYTLTYEERISALRALAERYPDDVFVQHRYQDFVRWRFYVPDELDRALASYEAGPEDYLAKYFHARLLMLWQMRKAEEMLKDVIREKPSFAWTHLALVEITETPGFLDTEKAEKHLRAFLGFCPDSLEAYAHYSNAEDPQLIRTGARRLRRLLKDRTDLEALPYYRHLWDLELRAVGKEKHEEVRQRVREDLKKLRSLEVGPSEEWYWVLRHGYEMVKDSDAMAAVDDAILQRFPKSQLALSVTIAHWEKEHPRPGRSATQQERRDYNQQYLEATNTWMKQWPGHPMLNSRRRHSLFMMPDLPVDQALAVVDGYLRSGQEQPDYGLFLPPAHIRAAEYYVKHNVRLEEVPTLIEQGLQAAERQEKYRLNSDRPELPDIARRAITWAYWFGHRVLADLALLRKSPEEARAILSQMAADLKRNAPGESASGREQREYQRLRREYFERMARLEELKGNKAEALKHFRTALQTLPCKPTETDKDPLVASAKRLYLELGGTKEEWLTWAAAPEGEVEETPRFGPFRFTKPLPEFEVKDQHGKTWRLADLRGRVTLLNVWATWCGPCRGELPYIQKLHERLKDRKDMLVLTLNTDENPSLAEVYLEEEGFTFPALMARSLADQIFLTGIWPQNWLVDPQGRRSQEMVPVVYDEEWVEIVLKEMESALASPGGDAP